MIFLHELREGLPFKGSSFRLIGYDTAVKINLNLISGFNSLSCFRTFNDRQTYVDGISVENPCKCLGYHTTHTSCFYRKRCVFP